MSNENEAIQAIIRHATAELRAELADAEAQRDIATLLARKSREERDATRVEIETLRDQGAEAFDATTAAYDAQTEELRAVTAERDDAIAAVRALLPHAEARALGLSERISLDVGAVECWEVIRAAKELLTKVSP